MASSSTAASINHRVAHFAEQNDGIHGHDTYAAAKQQIAEHLGYERPHQQDPRSTETDDEDVHLDEMQDTCLGINYEEKPLGNLNEIHGRDKHKYTAMRRTKAHSHHRKHHVSLRS